MERYDQLREQARIHLRLAAGLTDAQQKQDLLEKAFALAQQAEVLQREIEDRGSQRLRRTR